MSKIPEDEKVGPFFIRARALKGVWTAIAIDGDKIAERFEGHDTEDAALGAARAYATEQVAARRPPPRATGKRIRPGERHSLDDLRARFAKHFPQGFADPGYMAKERAYKDETRAALLAAVGMDDAPSATPAQCAAAGVAFSTNMLSPFENARVRQVLKGPDGPAFLRASAQVARGDTKAGLAEIERTVRPHGAPSWTIATYLPSLWAPDSRMLLRITATQRVANWLGHDFAARYAPQLTVEVHDALLDFANTIRASIADMAPRDLIDVQGFIWVVSEYR